MDKVAAIALNTFKETIRDRILYAIFAFTIIMCFLATLLGSLSIGNNIKIILDLGLASINIFGAIIAIFIGTSLVFKEVDRRTIYIILSKPLDRWEFILGKFFGLCLTLTLVVTCMSVVFILILLVYQLSIQQLYLTFVSLILILLELYLITSIAILFSSFSTPLLSMVFALCAWIIGNFNPIMLDLAQFSNSEMVVGIVTVLHYVLPDLSNFSIKYNIDNMDYVIDLTKMFFVFLYGLFYTSLVLTVSVLAFNRKEFN